MMSMGVTCSRPRSTKQSMQNMNCMNLHVAAAYDEHGCDLQPDRQSADQQQKKQSMQ